MKNRELFQRDPAITKLLNDGVAAVTESATQKEIEELISQANAEIQKVLADIRVIRITAQEEIAAQRKFTDAARIRSLSLEIQKESKKTRAPEAKKTKQLAAKK